MADSGESDVSDGETEMNEYEFDFDDDFVGDDVGANEDEVMNEAANGAADVATDEEVVVDDDVEEIEIWSEEEQMPPGIEEMDEFLPYFDALPHFDQNGIPSAEDLRLWEVTVGKLEKQYMSCINFDAPEDDDLEEEEIGYSDDIKASMAKVAYYLRVRRKRRFFRGAVFGKEMNANAVLETIDEFRLCDQVLGKDSVYIKKLLTEPFILITSPADMDVALFFIQGNGEGKDLPVFLLITRTSFNILKHLARGKFRAVVKKKKEIRSMGRTEITREWDLNDVVDGGSLTNHVRDADWDIKDMLVAAVDGNGVDNADGDALGVQNTVNAAADGNGLDNVDADALGVQNTVNAAADGNGLDNADADALAAQNTANAAADGNGLANADADALAAQNANEGVPP